MPGRQPRRLFRLARGRSLRPVIRSIFWERRRRYSVRRMAIELAARHPQAGTRPCGRRRVGRLMDEMELVAIQPKSFKPRTTGSRHGRASPSSRTFSVHLANGPYYRHKCHSRGNHLELWAAVHQLSLYDAALHLCRALAREVPWVHRW
jgi:hypothetical protein